MTGKPLVLEHQAPEPEPPVRSPRIVQSPAALAARAAAFGPGPRLSFVTRDRPTTRPPYDAEAHRERCRAEADRSARRYYTSQGVDPDAPDRDELRKKAGEHRAKMFAEGWTFIDGEPKRIEDWLKERDAQVAAREAAKERAREAAHGFDLSSPEDGPPAIPALAKYRRGSR